MSASFLSPTALGGRTSGLCRERDLGRGMPLRRGSRSCAEDARPGPILQGSGGPPPPCLAFLGALLTDCQKVFSDALALGSNAARCLYLDTPVLGSRFQTTSLPEAVPLLVLRVSLPLHT